MTIKNYFSKADNTITNTFNRETHIRATGSNMGSSPILEVYSLYDDVDLTGTGNPASAELSRVLIKFDINSMIEDRASSLIPGSGSVNFVLKMHNAKHSKTVPSAYTMVIRPIAAAWEEGFGYDMDSYIDLTYDGVGSNWMARTGDDIAATATWTFTDKPNEETTIKLVDYEGTSETFEVDNDGNGANTSGATPMDPATNNAAGMAAILISKVQASSIKITATTGGGATGEVLLTQDIAGDSGNTAITLSNYDNWNSNTTATFPTTFTSGKDYTAWERPGGHYLDETSDDTRYAQYFETGLEDLEVDITELVERWIASGYENYGVGIMLDGNFEAKYLGDDNSTHVGSFKNLTGSTTSYYTKKFHGRHTEFGLLKPKIQARWDDTIKDDRGNFYYSSSLATEDDNLNTIYLYNSVRGKLKNIPSIGDGEIFVNFYTQTGSDDNQYLIPVRSVKQEVGNAKELAEDLDTVVTGGWVSTGIYSCSVCLIDQGEDYPQIYDVWHSGDGNTGQFFTGSITPNRLVASSVAKRSKYITNVPNLNEKYNPKDFVRFRVIVRDKNWSPNVFTRVTTERAPVIINSGSYRVYRVEDEFEVVPFTTSSLPRYTSLAYDKDGNYFDFDMNLLESGYSYAFEFAYYDEYVSRYVKQRERFKFRVEQDEY